MLVQLDRNHFPGGSCQITRQASEARTNFQHSVRWPDLSRCDDLLEGDWILQKILSKTLVRAAGPARPRGPAPARRAALRRPAARGGAAGGRGAAPGPPPGARARARPAARAPARRRRLGGRPLACSPCGPPWRLSPRPACAPARARARRPGAGCPRRAGAPRGTAPRRPAGRTAAARAPGCRARTRRGGRSSASRRGR